MTEKPLHVRVAEAISTPRKVRVRGTADNFVDVWSDNPFWLTDGAHTEAELAMAQPPRYDTDWSATGPLIERFKVCLDAPARLCDAPDKHDCLKWKAGENSANDDALELTGDTPLLATCNLILALSAAGKLQPQEPEIVRAYRALAGTKGGEKP